MNFIPNKSALVLLKDFIEPSKRYGHNKSPVVRFQCYGCNQKMAPS